ncbi:MAG: hypothetical protein AAF736_09495 [Pseudomonadota bacterium]
MTVERHAGTEPSRLGRARELTHAACQWPSRAARANLPPNADDSHSNLGWNREHVALLSRPLDPGQRFQLGFRFADQNLLWLDRGRVEAEQTLVGASEMSAQRWVDARLSAADLKETSDAQMPYSLEYAIDYEDLTEHAAAAATLGRWFHEADLALQVLISDCEHLAVTRPEARCWPHHFDLASLFVLESGDPEFARSVGVGLSPGDGSYDEPYLYCTPWPAPPVAALPAAPASFRWHTDGFVSLVAPASQLNRDEDLGVALRRGFNSALTLASASG